MKVLWTRDQRDMEWNDKFNGLLQAPISEDDDFMVESRSRSSKVMSFILPPEFGEESSKKKKKKKKKKNKSKQTEVNSIEEEDLDDGASLLTPSLLSKMGKGLLHN